jgi:hypothetical protein
MVRMPVDNMLDWKLPTADFRKMSCVAVDSGSDRKRLLEEQTAFHNKNQRVEYWVKRDVSRIVIKLAWKGI